LVAFDEYFKPFFVKPSSKVAPINFFQDVFESNAEAWGMLNSLEILHIGR
jgi:hypothetical protein